MSVVIVGSMSRDLTAVSPRIPKEGETILGSKYIRSFGGKGANQAVMVSMLGSRSQFFGMAGQDTDGDEYLAHFKAVGVDTSAVLRTEDAPTGIAMIMVSSDTGENSIIVVPGANSCLSKEHVDAGAGALRAADAVLLQLEVPIQTAQAAAEAATGEDGNASKSQEAAEKTLIVLNPAPAPEDGLPASLGRLVDVVTPNQTECAMLARSARQVLGVEESAGEGGVEADVEAILRAFDMGAAVVTLGSQGSLVAVRGEGGEVATRRVSLLAPAGKQAGAMGRGAGEEVAAAGGGGSAGAGESADAGAGSVAASWPVVDTTGAGDAFNGALVHALCRGGGGAAGARRRALDIDALSRAAQAAGYVASTSVGALGTQSSYPKGEDLPAKLFDLE